MLGKKFNIKQIEMKEEMGDFILDEVRRVIETKNTSIDQTRDIKETLEETYGGEWQIIIGEGEVVSFFSPQRIENFIQLVADGKTMIIFRKHKPKVTPRNVQL